MAEPERVLGDIGSKLLFENDRVRVWELRLEPGAHSDIHRHDLDHLLVQIHGDKIAVIPESDSAGRYNDYMEGDAAPGNFVFVRRGGIESARNTGEQEYYELIIELKD